MRELALGNVRRGTVEVGADRLTVRSRCWFRFRRAFELRTKHARISLYGLLIPKSGDSGFIEAKPIGQHLLGMLADHRRSVA